MTTWNLIDSLSPGSLERTNDPAERRRFYSPLASIPLGISSDNLPTSITKLDNIDLTKLELELYPTPNGLPVETPHTEITISPPTGGFVNEKINITGTSLEIDIGEPSIRLHALGKGRISYSSSSTIDTTGILTIDLVMSDSRSIPWFKNWIEASCIPSQLIYQNIDISLFLNNLIKIRQENQSNWEEVKRLIEVIGIKLPIEVTNENFDQFIQDFKDSKAYLFVYSGVMIGTCGQDVMDSTKKSVKLLANYEVIQREGLEILQASDPMNPIELFNLIFYESPEVSQNPFLKKVYDTPLTNTGTSSDSNSLIRPPLRTSKRVFWEAKFMHNKHDNNWKQTGSLNPSLFKNRHKRIREIGTATYEINFHTSSSYVTYHKCNIFVSEIALRSGFKVGVIRPTITEFSYILANYFGNFCQKYSDKEYITGTEDDEFTKFMRNLNLEIESLGNKVNDIRDFINNKINVEGRCILLSCVRPRIFRKIDITEKINYIDYSGSPKVVNRPKTENVIEKDNPIIKMNSGHVVFIESVLDDGDNPRHKMILGNDPNQKGFRQIGVKIWEAGGQTGANQRSFWPATDGTSEFADADAGYIRIHPMELLPGKDPDTETGQRNLTVWVDDLKELNLSTEKAKSVKPTHWQVNFMEWTKDELASYFGIDPILINIISDYSILTDVVPLPDNGCVKLEDNWPENNPKFNEVRETPCQD